MINNYQLPRILRNIDEEHLAPYESVALGMLQGKPVPEGREEHPTPFEIISVLDARRIRHLEILNYHSERLMPNNREHTADEGTF